MRRPPRTAASGSRRSWARSSERGDGRPDQDDRPGAGRRRSPSGEVSAVEVAQAHLDRIDDRRRRRARLPARVHRVARWRRPGRSTTPGRAATPPRHRWPGCRWRSRTSSCSRAFRRPPARRSCRAGSRPTTRPSPRRLLDAGCGDPRQDQPRRVRDGLVDRELRVRADPQPMGPVQDPRRLRRRVGRRAGRLRGAAGHRHRHRRLDPAAGRRHRHRRHQTDLRRGVPVRGHRAGLVPRPGRPLRPHRHRHRAAARGHRRARPDGLDLDPAAGAAGAGRGPPRPTRRRRAACGSAW